MKITTKEDKQIEGKRGEKNQRNFQKLTQLK